MATCYTRVPPQANFLSTLLYQRGEVSPQLMCPNLMWSDLVFPTLVGMNRPAQRVCRGLPFSPGTLLRFNNRGDMLDLVTRLQFHDGRGNLHCMLDDIFPLGWTRTYGDGNVFGLLLGHDGWRFQTPVFHQLLLNGVLWATTQTTRQV